MNDKYPDQFHYHTNDGQEDLMWFKLRSYLDCKDTLIINYLTSLHANKTPGEFAGKTDDILNLTLRDLLKAINEAKSI